MDEDVVQVVTKTNSQQRQNKNYQAMVQGFSDKVSTTKIVCMTCYEMNTSSHFVDIVPQEEVRCEKEETKQTPWMNADCDQTFLNSSRSLICII